MSDEDNLFSSDDEAPKAPAVTSSAVKDDDDNIFSDDEEKSPVKKKFKKIKQKKRSNSENKDKKSSKKIKLNDGSEKKIKEKKKDEGAYDEEEEVEEDDDDKKFIAEDDDLKDIADEYKKEKNTFKDKEKDSGFEHRERNDDDDDRDDKKKKKKDNDISDEEIKRFCSNFLEKMDSAAERDYECIDKGEPAINKTKMLDEVKKVLRSKKQNSSVQRIFLDMGLLTVIDKWLIAYAKERGKKATYCSMNIRQEIFEILKEMPVESHDIKSSNNSSGKGLGITLMGMWKDTRSGITPKEKKQVQGLIEKWLRPIMDKGLAVRQVTGIDTGFSAANKAIKKTYDPEDYVEDDESKKYMHAMRPQEIAMEFTRKPEGKVIVTDQDKKNKANSQAQKMKKQMLANKRGGGADKFRMETLTALILNDLLKKENSKAIHLLMEEEEEIEAKEKTKRKDDSHLFFFTTDKGGMDKKMMEKTNQTVSEMSKNSAYYKKAKEKDEENDKKVEEMKMKINALTPLEIQRHAKEVQAKVEALERERDLSRIFCVVDMDMFFAAVAMRDDPSLVGKPVAVGGIGMISTANYEARKFNVRSAMPGFIAKELCPDLIFVRSDFPAYEKVAKETREIFAMYDPDYKAMSLDEAYLDITNYYEKNKDKYKDVEEVVHELRTKIFEKTKLTCSAGIACNVMLAKICSDKNKPNGQFLLPSNRDDILLFLKTLPARKIPGIGKVSEKILKDAFGIQTVKDLFEARNSIHALYSALSADFYLRVSMGICSTENDEEESARKSISNERTFNKLKQPNDLRNKLSELCESLSQEMKEKDLVGKNLTIKIKSSDFTVITRAVTLAFHTNDVDMMTNNAVTLLNKELPIKEGVRLMGVRMSQLQDKKDIEGKGNQNTLDSFVKKDAVLPSYTPPPSLHPSPSSSNKKDHKIKSKSNDKKKTSSPIIDSFMKNNNNKKERKEEEIECPICNTVLSGSNEDINTHLDICLNTNEIDLLHPPPATTRTADNNYNNNKSNNNNNNNSKRKQPNNDIEIFFKRSKKEIS